MKTLFSVLFFAAILTCKSQESAPSKAAEPVQEQALNTNTIQNPDAVINPSLESGSKVSDETIGTYNKSEKEKKEDKQLKNKKGRRGGNNNILIYVAIGIVAVAIIVYVATSSSTTKM